MARTWLLILALLFAACGGGGGGSGSDTSGLQPGDHPLPSTPPAEAAFLLANLERQAPGLPLLQWHDGAAAVAMAEDELARQLDALDELTPPGPIQKWASAQRSDQSFVPQSLGTSQ